MGWQVIQFFDMPQFPVPFPFNKPHMDQEWCTSEIKDKFVIRKQYIYIFKIFVVFLTEGNMNNNDNTKQNEYVAVKLITAHAKKQTDTATDIKDKANDDKELHELTNFG